jgi:hypothetical protein
VLWEKTYDIAYYDAYTNIRQTEDGGYIVAVATMSATYHFSGAILKLDGNGNVIWQRGMSNIRSFYIGDVQQGADGNYIAVGSASQLDPEATGAIVMKFDDNGDILWQKLYTDSNSIASIKPTSDGGYIALGKVYETIETSDIIVLKLDNNGQILWQKRFGGSDWEYGSAIEQTSDGGFIAAGATGSFGEGDSAAWIFKLNANGLVQWQKIYDGSENDSARSIQQTPDGGYIVAGVTESYGEGNQDVWVLKLDENGSIPNCPLVSPSNMEASQASVTAIDSNLSVRDLTLTPKYFSSDVEESQVLVRAWCWRKWEGRFGVLDWLDRARICVEWSLAVGVGIPQRCLPSNACIDCRYNLSKYMPAEKIPDFLFNIYGEITLILSGMGFQADPKVTLRQFENNFGNAPIGPFYTDTLKASILRKLKGSKKITPRLLGSLVEAINAIELDLIAPVKSEKEIKAAKYASVDFDGVAWVALNNVEKSGTATLKIKHGLPAAAKGMQPAWPIASYEFDFTGALAKNGYLDISFYIGGINLAGKISEARLLQWDGKHYRDITAHVDSKRGIITGRTNQLSAYVVMRPGSQQIGKLKRANP